MTIEVVMHRTSSGILTACVRQEGQLGSNLLAGRSFTKVESAQEALKGILWWKFRGELWIQWTIKA